MSDIQDKRLEKAMAEVAAAPKISMQGGKQYTQVATRVEMLRKAFGLELAITTEIITADERMVVMKASIADSTGRVVATGFAEEVRGGKSVNKTSALENGETSAIGRALAALGLAGGEYASADELSVALQQQRAQQANHQRTEQQRIEQEADQQAKQAADLAIEQINSAADTDTARGIATKAYRQIQGTPHAQAVVNAINARKEREQEAA